MQRITLIGFLESCSQNTIENTPYLEMMIWYVLSGHNLLGLSGSISTYKIREGTASLINAMISDANADVRLSTKVVKIHQDEERVNVLTDNGGLIKAKYALVTVPINTLNQIEYYPQLDRLSNELSSFKLAGDGFKVFLLAKGNLGNLWCCSVLSNCPLNCVMGYHFEGSSSVLVAYGYSTGSIDLNDHTQMQKVNEKLYSRYRDIKQLWTSME